MCTTDRSVRPLSEATSPDFAGLVERHKGVWGGCWTRGRTEPAGPGGAAPGRGRRPMHPGAPGSPLPCP